MLKGDGVFYTRTQNAAYLIRYIIMACNGSYNLSIELAGPCQP